MSDSLLSIVFIFAELGAVFLLLMVFLIVRFVLGLKKETANRKDLIVYIKALIPSHRDLLKAFYNEKLEQEKADSNIEILIKDEKLFYEHLFQITGSKDTVLLKSAVEDLDKLIKSYLQHLLLKNESVDAEAADNSEDSESSLLIIKKENEALRVKVSDLETSLKASRETLESMLREMAAMYEGGKDGSEEHLKNEKFKLKKELESEEDKIKAESAIDDLELGDGKAP